MKATVLACLALLLLSNPLAAHAATQTAAAPAAGAFLDVGGAKLWYEECGASNGGPTATTNVVLLHDGLVHSITWNAIWPALCAKYHVVRYDRRSYGRSDPAKAAFDPQDDLYKIMRQAHMDRAILVGNSSGGGLALDFAIAHPQMVDGLFLIGPVVHGAPTTDYFNARGAKNSAPLDKGDFAAAAENWSRDRFLIAGDDPPARKLLLDDLLQSPQNLRVDGSLELRPSPPTALRLSEIQAPVLVVVGEADIADVFAYCGAIVAEAPVAQMEVWEGTGHLIQLQQPVKLAARFDRFVATVIRPETHLSDQQLSAFVGEYQVGARTARAFVDRGRFVLEFPGDPYYRLFAASETKFFLRNDDAIVEFPKDAAGKVSEMVIHNSDASTLRFPRVRLEKAP